MKDPEAVASRDRALELQFSIFAFMWTVAGLFHLWNQINWPKVPFEPSFAQIILEPLLWIVGLAVLRDPRRVGPFLVFVGLEAIHVLVDVPRVANHWFVTGLVTLSILISAASLQVRGRLPTGAALLRSFGPAARWLILVAYSFAALAKFNWDFVDLEVSCASTTWVDIGEQWIKGLPTAQWAQAAAIVVTIVVEAAMPILLLTGRWRGTALIVGGMFHYLISFTPLLRVPDFASMLFALWFLFTPAAFSVRAMEQIGTVRSAGARRFPFLSPRRLGVGFLAASGLGAVALAVVSEFKPGDWFQGFRLVAFIVYGMFCLIVLILANRPEDGSPMEETAGMFRLKHAGHVLLVLIALITGCFPYVGLRTRTNLSMFSNLMTEGHRSNHLFMPQLYLTSHQLDLVQVHGTSHVKVAEMTADGMLLPWWELRYRIHDDADAWIRYTRAGETVETLVGEHAQLSSRPGFLERQLLAFRPVPAEGRMSCAW